MEQYRIRTSEGAGRGYSPIGEVAVELTTSFVAILRHIYEVRRIDPDNSGNLYVETVEDGEVTRVWSPETDEYILGNRPI